MLKKLLLFGAFCGAGMAFAEEITAEQSQMAVEAWMKKYGAITGKAVRRIETIADPVTGAQIHVAVLRGGGFVVTAADDRVLPVMAYSETGTFVNDPGNPLLQILQSDASAAKEAFGEEFNSTSGVTKTRLLRASATGVAQGRTDAQKEWDELLGRTSTSSRLRLLTSMTSLSSSSDTSLTETRVKPLLHTEWGQTTHNGDVENVLGGSGLLCFNYYTPEWPVETTHQISMTSTGINMESADENDKRYTTHYPCGCVATAGAQIMRKWKEPSSRFAFGSMPEKPAGRTGEDGRKAIGKLTRAIGTACDATYGPNTEMSTPRMVGELVSSFSYAGAFWRNMQDADFADTSGSVCNFDKQVIPNLIAKCPVVMSLAGDNRHCVVVDGLRYVGSVRKIHVNFGWFINGSTSWYVPQTFKIKYETWDEKSKQMVTKTVTYNSVTGIGINIHPNERKAIIAGRVAYYTDGGLNGAVVILKKNGTKVNDATTDEHGQFHFLVDGGTYSLEISKAGYVTRTVSNVEVTCADSSVQNYYNDIYLTATTTEQVAMPDVAAEYHQASGCYIISMSCKTEGASIHYTFDGTIPTEGDPAYSTPRFRSAIGTGNLVVMAKAYKEGLLESGVNQYTCPLISAETRNSQLSKAIVLMEHSGTTAFNNASAAKEIGEPVHSVMGKAGGASMWASFTAPEDGDYTFAASGCAEGDEDSALDTQLAVYTGNSVNALTLVAANDDVNAAEYDLSSKVAFRATKGVTYKIAVDTRNGERGTLNLEWKEGREDVASPVEYDVYCTAENRTYSIPVRSTATWSVCDGSDWITVKKSSGSDGESLSFELPAMTDVGMRSGVLLVCAGEDGPSSTIRITQGTTSWVTSRSDALATAKANGKRILMVCGRDTCSNTSYTRFTACEDATVKPLLLEGYVLWYCNCDEQWEDYYYYTDGLGGYTLPLVCIIDPVRPDAYVARSTGRLTASQLRQLLVDNAEGDLPTQPFEVFVDGSAGDGTISVLWGAARRAQSYEVWRGTKWNPAEAIRIASDVRTERYVDDTAEPSVLYYYRVRAVNGVGVGEMSMPAAGCWRDAGAHGEAAIGDALGAPHLDWTSEGDYPWTVQGTNTYDGAAAMQSAFTDPKQSGVASVLKTTVTGPTKMSFRYKTRMYSSRFTVKIDGTEAFLVTGAVSDWTLAVVEIPEGSHEIEFSYAKGGYYTSGFNGVFLDQVQFDVVSDPPSLRPATTDDEESALTFTGSMAVSIDAPEGSEIYYTLDGSDPTPASQRYEGPFTLTASTRVKAVCVQDGYDCSATVSGLYLERHPVQAGEWTTDVEGAKKAALKDGSIIVTLLANYETCGYSRAFAAISESSEFLSWARANGVYLITADSSRAVGTEAAYNRFWDLFYDVGQSGSAYYPALAIASAWEPDRATGYAVARSGRDIGGVAYDGTVATLKSGISSFFTTRPSNSYVWIEFDGNGGTLYEKSRVGISGQTIGEFPSVYRPYHYFEGWFTLADGGTEVSEETVLDGDAVYYAHWSPYRYRVQFDAGGGLVSPTYKYVFYGLDYGDLPTPTRTQTGYSYRFDGWYTAASGGMLVTADAKVAITAAQTLYAHWTESIETYSVTYAPGVNGVGAQQSDTKTYNVALSLKGAIFMRTGYTQTGWTTADGGTKVYDLGSSYTANSTVTLYPVWTLETYVVTFDANGGAGGWSGEMAYGSPIAAPTVTWTGHMFKGWSPNVAETVPASNVTYTAQWTVNQYTVTFDANGGEGGWSEVMDYGAAIVAPTVTWTGHTFKGWSSEVAETVPVGGATYVAQWEIERHTVTLSLNGGDGEGSVVVDYGTKVGDIAVPTRTGHTFAGWFADAEGGNPVDGETPVTVDMELHAQWTANEYTVAYDPNGGTGEMTDMSLRYGVVTNLDACAFAWVEHAFAGWATNKTGEVLFADGAAVSNLTAEADGSVTLFAVWDVNQYTFTFDANGGSEVAPITQGYGTAVAAPAAPTYTGYTFAGWTPAIPATMPAENMKFTAQWMVNAYTVTFDPNGGTGTMAAQEFVYDEEQLLNECAFTLPGYEFRGWSLSADSDDIAYFDGENVENLTDAADGNVTLYAVWEYVPVPVPAPPPSQGDDPAPAHGHTKLWTPVASGGDVTGGGTSGGDALFTGEVAETYNGYVQDSEGKVVGTIQVKAAKAKNASSKITATIQLVAEKKKQTVKGILDTNTGKFEGEDDSGRALSLLIGENSLSGTYGPYFIDGAQNKFTTKRTASKALGTTALSKWQGTWSVAWPDEDGWSGASLSIAAKGKVKVSCVLANGTKVSASSQLLVGEGGVCAVPVVVTKKVQLAFNVWFSDAGVEVSGLDGAVAGNVDSLKSGAAFRIDATALSSLLGQTVLPYLPDGASVAQDGNKWVVASGAKAGKVVYLKGTTEVDADKLGENPSGLKITFTAKAGTFKGSFKAYADVNGAPKATTVNIAGVLVDGVGYGAATIKKVGGVPITVE